MIDKSKRFFLRRASPFKSFLYPPYYEKKENFINCLECEEKACVNACSEKIIQITDGIPSLNFAFSGCTFCNECAKACDNVLKVENKRKKINGEFLINYKTCLAWNKTVCYSCYDICGENAIIYKGMFNPIINTQKCTACGFCINVCPADSIEVLAK